MKRVPEVEQLLETLADGMRRGDAGAVLATISPNVTVFSGTDDDEWWRGYEEVAAGMTAQLEATGGFDVMLGSPTASGDGSFCVFEDRPEIKTPDGQTFTPRFTGAAAKESGQWRIVQAHMSFGTPNTDIGFEDLPV